MEEKLQAIKTEALEQLKKADSLDRLNEIRVSFPGKEGPAHSAS